MFPTDQAYEIVAPRPEALIESLRSFGYSPETSIADLIDNSITAGARNVWVDFYWAGGSSWVSVRDDGCGMTESELSDAMRAGSSHPLAERRPEDLGRFGLGLKTASFAQCRNVTVRSKREGAIAALRRWDLDYVNETREWRLLKEATGRAQLPLELLDHLSSGTVVLWENLDRLVDIGEPADSDTGLKNFLDIVARVEAHVAMVFHRFLSGTGKLAIFVNHNKVLPWDPFLRTHEATQALRDESVQLFGGVVGVEPFVLPHASKLSEDEHKHAAGPEGWNAQQGFYIYRNRRMVVAGSWLGFFRQEEHYKLARIQVDIQNSMDQEWDVDVRKARARPPDAIREDLKRIARLTRERAVAVYRHRGRQQTGNRFVSGPAWQGTLTASGHVAYRIRRDHPLVQAALVASTPNPKPLNALLRLLEETVPVQQIWLDAAARPDGHAEAFAETPDDLADVMTEVFSAFLKSGLSRKEAGARLAELPPFDAHPHLINELVEARRH
ncbi:MAG TPA: ATP-binding protein [Tepidiformaceae bacterium]|nr:ATP-binding protein [Tepidiformaceae bacterium]